MTATRAPGRLARGRLHGGTFACRSLRQVGDRDIGPTCEALAVEPLFHLLLHSKELFHSNLLGRLCETHPEAATRVFANWVPVRTAASQARVQREPSHLDLARQAMATSLDNTVQGGCRRQSSYPGDRTCVRLVSEGRHRRQES